MRFKLILVLIASFILLYFWYSKTTTEEIDINIINQNKEATSEQNEQENKEEITATFKIITNGTTRIFTDSKYHNLSDDIYITSKDPNKIEIKNENITWSDFFKTLPMSLDKNCLVTGTKQTFCTNDTKKLYFYLNNTEAPNALDKLIKENDYLLVEYK